MNVHRLGQISFEFSVMLRKKSFWSSAIIVLIFQAVQVQIRANAKLFLDLFKIIIVTGVVWKCNFKANYWEHLKMGFFSKQNWQQKCWNIQNWWGLWSSIKGTFKNYQIRIVTNSQYNIFLCNLRTDSLLFFSVDFVNFKCLLGISLQIWSKTMLWFEFVYVCLQLV